MKPQFRVHIDGFSNLQEIPGRRQENDFIAILEALDFGDIEGMSASDLREMCIMSLQDLEPEEAAEVILKHDLGERLKQGQIKNIAHEMLDEKLWEEYSDLSLHEAMFNAGSLLYSVFPKSFPRPDAVSISLDIVATNKPAKEIIEEELNETFIVRLLAGGMGEHSVLQRLFEKQLIGSRFDEADKIIWIMNQTMISAEVAKVDVISSGYWLDALQQVKDFESTAFADETP